MAGNATFKERFAGILFSTPPVAPAKRETHSVAMVTGCISRKDIALMDSVGGATLRSGKGSNELLKNQLQFSLGSVCPFKAIAQGALGDMRLIDHLQSSVDKVSFLEY